MKTSGRSFAAFINASVFVALNSIAAQPQAKPDTAVGKLDVDGHFSPSEGKISAKDLSGIACMEPSGDKARHCVVVNDENRTAQLVTIINKKIIVGAEVALSREAPSNATLGAQPVVECPKGKGGFKEFDGEGVAYAAPYFYVTGSHGCSRKSGKFRLSSFLLARFRLSPEAWSVVEKRKLKVSSRELIAPVETTYRLSDAVRNQAALSDFFGKDLMNGNGLNIEGIAVINGKLFAGLRAPSQDGNAYLVSAPLKELFAPGRAPMALGSEVIPLALGKDVGIRDLASLSNGNLLVLAGPAQEQKNIRYAFFEAEPRAHGKVKALEKISNMNKGAKAEAVTVLNHGSRTMHVLVLFDGEENGAPTEYIIRKTDN